MLPTSHQTVSPVGLRLDADTPGADGYMEQVILSREGVEVVFACFLAGAAPQMLMDATNNPFTYSGVNYALFVRPSDASSPGVAPIDSW